MMYMKSIALFVAIYGRTALAALSASCEVDNNCSNACTPLNSEFEPPGVGQVWFSHCCTVSDTNTEDPPVTESKKYCFSYYLTGYPNNQFFSTKPICSETGSGTLAWLPKGQCGTSSGTAPYTQKDAITAGCPGQYDSSNDNDYEAGDMVEDNQVVYTCSGAAAFCNLYEPNLKEGCPEEFDSGTTYEAYDRVSVTRADDSKVVYACKAFPESQWCNVATYSPLNTDKQCNGEVCWPLAWTRIGGCLGSYSPTGTPTFDPANVEGCPEEYDDGSEYEGGDRVSVTAAGEDYGKIYECKAWPEGDHCGNEAYSPLNTEKLCNDQVCWPIAWTYIKGCTGTITPTATPTFDPNNVEGCPEEYDDGTEYEEGDKVSVTAAGEDYGKIYQCKAWPEGDHCGNEAYSPLNTEKLCNDQVCWPIAWTYIKGCTGTITPTATPTFDPADVGGCPDEFEEGTDYEEGDKMSIISDGEDYGKIYKCKGWPYTGHCKSEAFSPLNTAKACSGEVCWPVAWTYEGGCTGTITPTAAPQFTTLSQWDKQGCPPEYVPNNSAYKPEDYVSVPSNEDNTYGVVWQCKNAMTAPWCQQEGYAPGTPNGGQAWEKVGFCAGTISPTDAPTMLASNPNPIKRVCQFKYKLDTTSDGEYIVLQAGSWQKGGTTIATVTGGTPFDLYKPGHLVRDGRVARKCNPYPYSLYCSGWSPFVQDSSNYNPTLSRLGWDEATCEDVEHTNQASEVLSGKNDEFVSNLGPLFASNGHLLVKKDGTCVNLAINPEDYFKSSPAVKGCQKCATDNGFGSSADPTLCTPCQGGATSKIVDGKSQCVLSNGATSSGEPSASPSTSGVPTNQPSDLPSNVPTNQPSDLPSSEPSLNPSFSTNPTSEPSSEPSSQPSSQPSLSPSGSVQPSSEPSLNPSFSTNPTSEPSSEPSSQPSSQPSSDQPSDLPSAQPSLSLSPSTVLAGSYEYVGVGYLVTNGNYYNFVIFAGVVTANACAVKCNECVAGNVSGGAFRGFVFNSSHQLCDCNFDNNAVYTENGSNGSCTEGVLIDSRCGFGQVTGSSLHAGAVSYKIKA
ncbi:PT domain-containing protein [Skeletonema marinoi]|uniref:PT domain-containing protein n=1 Tax=Skeletonema marinoi TaxID=267567 RepID=A0AAD8XRU1_9STRA|nr:PT domain-containing protein [Skeletonema marinoi]